FQKPQYLNAKRFRDEYGKLTEKVAEIARKTLPEALNYYTDGDRYEKGGKIYTFKVTDENMLFASRLARYSSTSPSCSAVLYE
ncbi:hypothetical protein, partial [Qingrenia yutianensis]